MNNKYCLLMTLFCLVFNCLNIASAQPNFSWGVVYGSETNIQEAQTEINQLPGRLPQYRNLERLLFKRSNFYVSVILFPTKQDANNALPIIENEYKRGSFVRSLNEWCRPNWSNYRTAINGISYYDCGN
ncbi:MAG: hypothetical protein PX481_00905 [Microcystis sp. M53603_WE2]|jgi:hypothetical protein|uniref:hypothetical protein n=1 Tax=unclassified Microcystis TaxID=2643300 RepID=UPI0025892DEE|nr:MULTISPECIES: hypothetical protein [unclassified Microcystis]MCE2662609.1 hypothetical protein [Microcystis sp. 53602_E8]MDJ0530863.1 hypothetical protein [Microcystis sp. M53600_WE12]MDJ0564496.1 hypothetical protein [Microcystis sp. M49629_WE12]MDJ0537280.1 hypothetical protein [Microcystis sp. M53603_WE2]MDJ0604383.1 hypothetical protein [Microcystis sp. M53602_WE12]